MSYNDNAPKFVEVNGERLQTLRSTGLFYTSSDNISANESFLREDPNGDIINVGTGQRYSYLGGSTPFAAQVLAGTSNVGRTLTEEYNLDEGIISGEEALEEIQFQSQCVLLENYESLVKFNYNTAYKNFISVHGNPNTIVNNLTSRTDVPAILGITQDQLSQLTPTIRLFKIYYDKKTGKEIKQIELPFDQYYDTKKEQTNTISVGGGVGLLDFNWKYVGAHPAETLNNIEATLRLRFQNISDITSVRNIEGNKFRYIDLLIRNDRPDDGKPKAKTQQDYCTKSVNNRKYDIDYFTIKVIVGWEVPDNAFEDFKDNKGDSPKKAKELRESIRSTKTILYLTLTKHEIDFRQDGSVILKLDGNARHDAAKKIGEADVFSLYKQRYSILEGEILKATAQRKKIEDEAGDEPSKFQERQLKAIDEQIDSIQSRVDAEKARVQSAIFKELIMRDRIFQVEIPTKDLEISKPPAFRGLFGLFSDNSVRVADRERQQFLRQYRRPENITPTKFRDCDKLLIDPSKSSSDRAGEEARNKTERAIKDGYLIVPFIYFGDLVDIALESIYGTGATVGVGTRTLLGDVLIFDSRLERKVSISMADIPISMWLFQDWMIERVYKQQRASYPVSKFIADAINELIYEALKPDGCFGETPAQQFKVGSTLFYLPMIGDRPPIDSNNFGRIVVDKVENLGARTGESPSMNHVAYNLFYTQIVDQDHEPYGYDNAFKKGIHTMQLGQSNGLVKEINFQRKDHPYMREAILFDEEGTSIAQLREHYRAEISMYGNNLYINGQTIFINPSTIAFGDPSDDRSDGNILGITGYYMIDEVENYIGPGQFETTLSGYWVAAGSGKARGVFNTLRRQQCLAEDPDAEQRPDPADFDLRFLNRWRDINDPVSLNPERKKTFNDILEEQKRIYEQGYSYETYSWKNPKLKKKYEELAKRIEELSAGN
jgi:hypothetical protein